MAVAGPARADLFDYVKAPDPSFEWKLHEKIDHPLGTVYDLHLVSQTWQKIRRRSGMERRCESQYAVMVSPTTYSMTMYGWPSSMDPPS